MSHAADHIPYVAIYRVPGHTTCHFLPPRTNDPIRNTRFSAQGLTRFGDHDGYFEGEVTHIIEFQQTGLVFAVLLWDCDRTFVNVTVPYAYLDWDHMPEMLEETIRRRRRCFVLQPNCSSIRLNWYTLSPFTPFLARHFQENSHHRRRYGDGDELDPAVPMHLPLPPLP